MHEDDRVHPFLTASIEVTVAPVPVDPVKISEASSCFPTIPAHHAVEASKNSCIMDMFFFSSTPSFRFPFIPGTKSAIENSLSHFNSPTSHHP